MNTPKLKTYDEYDGVLQLKLYGPRDVKSFKAMKVDEPFMVIVTGGLEIRGESGDYLVRTPSGALRVSPGRMFEANFVEIDVEDSPYDYKEQQTH